MKNQFKVLTWVVWGCSFIAQAQTPSEVFLGYLGIESEQAIAQSESRLNALGNSVMKVRIEEMKASEKARAAKGLLYQQAISFWEFMSIEAAHEEARLNWEMLQIQLESTETRLKILKNKVDEVNDYRIFWHLESKEAAKRSEIARVHLSLMEYRMKVNERVVKIGAAPNEVLTASEKDYLAAQKDSDQRKAHQTKIHETWEAFERAWVKKRIENPT